MKRIVTLLLCIVLLAVGVNAAFEKVNTYSNNFSDVTEQNWFYENVKTAYELGFMNGKAEGQFDPSGNVTVAEGITMASRLHAIYNNSQVTEDSVVVNEYVIAFDEPDKNITTKRATGKYENGIFVVQPDKPNDRGAYDAQMHVANLELDSRLYNRVVIRMRFEELPNPDPSKPRNKDFEFFFKTNTSPAFSGDKQINKVIAEVAPNPSEWFEIVIEGGEHEKWTDNITGIRFDPSNNNGIYYIDSITFSKTSSKANAKWYDMYVNYAIDRKIMAKDAFGAEDFTRNITRAEMCDLLAGALPEDYFTAINDVKGIPDVLRDAKNADIYLMLYRAGILLGSDEKGTFNAQSDIKRSEVAAIINRAALPENRVKGTIAADWAQQGNEYDLEFDNESYLTDLTYEAETLELKNGAVVLKAKERPTSVVKYDPKITVKDINVDATLYSKLKVRMKVEFLGEVTSTRYDFYFMTEGDEKFTEAKSMHQDFVEFSYIDPAGWYVMEVDLRNHGEWKGNVTSFRFDPANTNGIYTIDYIRLAQGDPLHGASHEMLLSKGYTATKLLQDADFENGFYVSEVEQKKVDLETRKWQDYSAENAPAPSWRIGPWWTKHDLWENRDTTTDKYTLKDTYGINTITYNPESKSITMRLDATKVYNGAPHDENFKWWPHLLLDQGIGTTPVDVEKNRVSDNRMFAEFDIRLLDFKNTTNTEGKNNCAFLIYFYLRTDKVPGKFIYFGLRTFNGLGAYNITTPGWSPDTAAGIYMYGIQQATVFGNIQNSFNPEKGVAAVSDEWKHVRLDVTHHVDRCVEWANRDNIFGVQITKDDLYWAGVNIGYEIHGNYDCTFEFKNLNMVSYSK